jgi:Fe2+ or Zn2+ uptake regulation protein
MAKLRRQSRKTKQFELIWRTIRDDHSHPTADQVYGRVRKKLSHISLGTVYRNLQKLVAQRKLQILMLGRAQHFDPLVERHQHFICESCDRVFDVMVSPLGDNPSLALPHDAFKVTSHQLALYGACKKCAG